MAEMVPDLLHTRLCSAIQNRLLVEFEYHGLPRIAEPHDYGVVEENKAPKLLAYQIEGKSRSGTLPDWRFFEVPDIRQIRVLRKKFAGTRPVPSGKHKKWHRIFASVSLPGE